MPPTLYFDTFHNFVENAKERIEITRNSHCKGPIQKLFLKILSLEKLQWGIYASLFLIKLQDSGVQLY